MYDEFSETVFLQFSTALKHNKAPHDAKFSS